MKNWQKLFTLLIAVVVAAGAALIPASSANAASYFRIQSYGSGMCIQPPPSNPTGIGLRLEQQPCNGSAAQNWAAVFLSSGRYSFVNQSTGGCMDVAGSYVMGTPVDTWPCSGISNVRWHVGRSLPVFVPTTIKTVVNGLCLDVMNGSTHAGAFIQIYGCIPDNPTQAWMIH